MRYAAVLSDLDGTLVDSHPAVRRAWLAWAHRHGVEDRVLAEVMHGRPAREVIARVTPQLSLDEEAAEIERMEVADTEGVTALPGARELLERAGRDRLAVVTSCTEPLAVARLAAAGLPLPGVLVTASRVSRGKPDPEGYVLAARELGVAPRDCAVLEDAPAGIAAALAAGATVIAVGPEADGARAHHRAADVREALALLGLPAG